MRHIKDRKLDSFFFCSEIYSFLCSSITEKQKEEKQKLTAIIIKILKNYLSEEVWGFFEKFPKLFYTTSNIYYSGIIIPIEVSVPGFKTSTYDGIFYLTSDMLQEPLKTLLDDQLTEYLQINQVREEKEKFYRKLRIMCLKDIEVQYPEIYVEIQKLLNSNKEKLKNSLKELERKIKEVI